MNITYGYNKIQYIYIYIHIFHQESYGSGEDGFVPDIVSYNSLMKATGTWGISQAPRNQQHDETVVALDLDDCGYVYSGLSLNLLDKMWHVELLWAIQNYHWIWTIIESFYSKPPVIVLACS